MRLQVDLGVDHRHQEGGQEEGDGQQCDGRQAGEGRLAGGASITPGPQVGVSLVEEAGQSGHQTSH